MFGMPLNKGDEILQSLQDKVFSAMEKDSMIEILTRLIASIIEVIEKQMNEYLDGLSNVSLATGRSPEDLCGLQETEQHLAGGRLPYAQDQRYTGPVGKATVHIYDGPDAGLLASSGRAKGKPQDGFFHT